MPEIKLTPARPGRLNRPAWFRAHTADYGPARRTDGVHGPVNAHDVYLDGENIGTVIGTLTAPGSSLRSWAPETLVDGITPHGSTRFEAMDAIVRGFLPAARAGKVAA